jgi:hypothetical protein
MPPTKKQTRVAQKGKKEPMRYMAVSSAVYKASAKEQRAFHEMFKQGISKKKKHVVVDGNMVITTWK